MGIFDWFQRNARRTMAPRDCIWLTKTAKFQGIARQIAAPPGDSAEQTILVAHFRDTRDLLRLIAEKAGVGRSVTPLLASELPDYLAHLGPLSSDFVRIVAGERHLLAARDQALLEAAADLPCRCEVTFHSSLEDPVLRAFAGNWVENALRGLGMAEDESIESQMVMRRVVAAQKELERTCIGDVDAESAEEWMKTNCPTAWQKLNSRA